MIEKIRSAVVSANFQWTYVRVYTDDDGGIYGTGECFFGPGLPAIIREFENILTGEDPTNIERLVEKMRWAASGAGSLGGIIWNAITGIEAALWDLKGKLTGQPVYQLLGGKFREGVRIYLDCHAEGSLECLDSLLQPTKPAWVKSDVLNEQKPDPEEIIAGSARRAAAMVDLGYTALKFDLDLPGSAFDSPEGYTLRIKDMDWMIRLVHEVRASVPNADLAFDAHWRYRANEILQVMKELESCRLLWLEDPVPPQDKKGLQYLRQHTSTPIGTGENLQLVSGFYDLCTQNLADVITPDLQKAGGLCEAKKIAALAEATNKPIAPHMIGSPLAIMASSHFALSIPNFLVCEFHAHDVPFFHELVQGGTSGWFKHGWITPLNKPGFGIEIDEKHAQKYQLPGTDWF